eukprot:Hpha_TRINITY_DN32037_c0_g1::TRINITY_DN32037_c0_g1_i1::g.115936::m.115936/K13783/SLC37A1_2; MFS transporter, OPA family, solute carrier family 37 (glycerol-3-phosphate transporter), member 1/2
MHQRHGASMTVPPRAPESESDAQESVTVMVSECGATPSSGPADSSAQRQSGFTSKRFFRALLPTWLAYASYIIARKPFSVTRLVVESEVGLTPMMSGLVDTAFLVTYSVGQIFYSLVRSRLSIRAVIALGLSGAACCCFVFAAFPYAWVMVAAWGMNGVFESFGWPSCVSVVTPWLGQKERGKVMGIWGSNQAIGSLLGNWLAASLLHQWGWKGSFYGCFAPVLVVAIILYLSLHEHPNRSGYVSPHQWEQGTRVSDLQGCPLSADGECLMVDDAEKRKGE